jgi:hypothetical protein
LCRAGLAARAVKRGYPEFGDCGLSKYLAGAIMLKKVREACVSWEMPVVTRLAHTSFFYQV